MPPVNAEGLDWARVTSSTVAPTIAELACPACTLYTALEALAWGALGATSGAFLRDLAALAAAARNGRFLEQLQEFRNSYGEAILPFQELVAAYRNGDVSVCCLILQMAFSALGFVGRLPVLVAHMPSIACTSPVIWLGGKVAACLTAWGQAKREARKDLMLETLEEVRRYEERFPRYQVRTAAATATDGATASSVKKEDLGWGGYGGFGRA